MTAPLREIALHAVCIGKVRPLGVSADGKTVRSGFRKQPTLGPTVRLLPDGIDGDRQADLRVHGGLDKAVYAYPAEHLPVWTAELGLTDPLGPNAFGENLSIGGLLEDEACVGDVWSWGSALLQISQPRAPCAKLGIAHGRLDLPKLFTASGRSGIYLRVLRVGEAPVAGPIALVERHPDGLTVREAHLARLPEADPALRARALACAPLAAAWKRGISG
jgi:MOSC domain-containing protein YiiM